MKDKNETIIFSDNKSDKKSYLHLDTNCDAPQKCSAMEYYAERIAYLEGLVKKYKFDYLTGLMGKQDFVDKFDRVFEEYSFADTPFTLIIADIDGLHNINRLHGMKTGDKYITSVGVQLKEAFDFHQIFRISGDEFCVLARDCVVPHNDMITRMETIDNISFIATKSNGYTNPKQMFKETDARLTKLKAQNKTEERI